ncbi:MAG: zinc-ribbon domain-containing protein, partial [Clostridia bacterium]|nr:zinc-ribbon domain-containing protein [Clostridia bacterium]
MAKFCQNCGAPLNEGAKFCPTCGAGVGAPAPQP